MSTTDVAWDEIERLTRVLARHLPAAAGAGGPLSFDRILGVARGGLVPAVLLASRLAVPSVESVQVRLYEGRRCLAEPALVGGCPAPAGPSGDPARTLVVDEILDSGRTLGFLRARFPAACFCALIGRRAAARGRRRGPLTAVPAADASGTPVWVAGDVVGDEWVLFPWSPAEDRDAAP